MRIATSMLKGFAGFRNTSHIHVCSVGTNACSNLWMICRFSFEPVLSSIYLAGLGDAKSIVFIVGGVRSDASYDLSEDEQGGC